MIVGIDVGTSGVRGLAIDAAGAVQGQVAEPCGACLRLGKPSRQLLNTLWDVCTVVAAPGRLLA